MHMNVMHFQHLLHRPPVVNDMHSFPHTRRPYPGMTHLRVHHILGFSLDHRVFVVIVILTDLRTGGLAVDSTPHSAAHQSPGTVVALGSAPVLVSH